METRLIERTKKIHQLIDIVDLIDLYDSEEISNEEAFEYFKYFADDGNSTAQNYIGKMYLDGVFIQQDIELALFYFKLSADQNYPDSVYNLAEIYKNHYRDYNKFFKYARKAVDLLNDDAYIELAPAYYYGVGTRQYEDAYIELASAYYYGVGTRQDYDLAYNNYILAIKEGNLKGYVYIGMMYYNGNGFKQDYKIAYNIFNIYNDHYISQYYLGEMYMNGYYMPRDIAKAFVYYKLAADRGVKRAIYYVAIMYYNGYGIDKNIDMYKQYISLIS